MNLIYALVLYGVRKRSVSEAVRDFWSITIYSSNSNSFYSSYSVAGSERKENSSTESVEVSPMR